jgi:hypothetical protein
MRARAAVAGLLGGLAWIAAYVADGSSDAGLVEALTWSGVVLLAWAVVLAGASLVSRSATWLRVLVSVCLTALVGSVLQVVRDAADPVSVDAVVGVLAVVASVVALRRRPVAAGPAATGPVRGSHARGSRARGSHAR